MLKAVDRIQLPPLKNLPKNSQPIDIVSCQLFKTLNLNENTLQKLNTGLLSPEIFINAVRESGINIRNRWFTELNKKNPEVQLNIQNFLITYLINYSHTPELQRESFFQPCIELAIENTLNLMLFFSEKTDVIINNIVNYLTASTPIETQLAFARQFVSKLMENPDEANIRAARYFITELVRKLANTEQVRLVESYVSELKDHPIKNDDVCVNCFIEGLYLAFHDQMINHPAAATKDHIASLFQIIAKTLPIERAESVFTSTASVVWPTISPKNSPKTSPRNQLNESSSHEQKKKKPRKKVKNATIIDRNSPIKHSSSESKGLKKKKRRSPKLTEIKEIPKMSELDLASSQPLPIEPDIKAESMQNWAETTVTFNKIANSLDIYFNMNDDPEHKIKALNSLDLNAKPLQMHDLLSDEENQRLSEIKQRQVEMQEALDESNTLLQKIADNFQVFDTDFLNIDKQENNTTSQKINILAGLKNDIEVMEAQLAKQITILNESVQQYTQQLTDNNDQIITSLQMINSSHMSKLAEYDEYILVHFIDYPSEVKKDYIQAQTNKKNEIADMLRSQVALPEKLQHSQAAIAEAISTLTAKKDNLLHQIQETNETQLALQKNIDDKKIAQIREIYLKTNWLATIEKDLPESLQLSELSTLSYEELLSNTDFSTHTLEIEDNEVAKSTSQYAKYCEELAKLRAYANCPSRFLDLKGNVNNAFQETYRADRATIISDAKKPYTVLTSIAQKKQEKRPAEFFAENNLKNMKSDDLIELSSQLDEINRVNVKNSEAIELLKNRATEFHTIIIEKDNAYTQQLTNDIDKFNAQKSMVEKLKNEVLEEKEKIILLRKIKKYENKLANNAKDRKEHLDKSRLQYKNINKVVKQFDADIQTFKEEIAKLEALDQQLSSKELQSKYVQFCDENSRLYFVNFQTKIKSELKNLTNKLKKYEAHSKDIRDSLEKPLQNKGNRLLLFSKDGNDSTFNYNYDANFAINNEAQEVQNINNIVSLSSLKHDNIQISDLNKENLKNQVTELKEKVRSTYVHIPKDQEQPPEIAESSPAILKLSALFKQIRDRAPILKDVITADNKFENVVDLFQNDQLSKPILEELLTLVESQNNKNHLLQNEFDMAMRAVKKASLVPAKEKLQAIENHLQLKNAHFETLRSCVNLISTYKKDTSDELLALHAKCKVFEKIVGEIDSEQIKKLRSHADLEATTAFIAYRESIIKQVNQLKKEIKAFSETQTTLENSIKLIFPDINSGLDINSLTALLQTESTILNQTADDLQKQKQFIETQEKQLADQRIDVADIKFDVEEINRTLANIDEFSRTVSNEQEHFNTLASNQGLLGRITSDISNAPEKQKHWNSEIDDCKINTEKAIFNLKKAALGSWHAAMLHQVKQLQVKLKDRLVTCQKQCDKLEKLPESIRQENADLTTAIAKNFRTTYNRIIDSTQLSDKEKDSFIQEVFDISQNLKEKDSVQARVKTVKDGHQSVFTEQKNKLDSLTTQLSKLNNDLTSKITLPNSDDEDEESNIIDNKVDENTKLFNHAFDDLSQYQTTLDAYENADTASQRQIEINLGNYQKAFKTCKESITIELNDAHEALKKLNHKLAQREFKISLHKLKSIRNYSLVAIIPFLGAIVGTFTAGPVGFVAGFMVGCALIAGGKAGKTAVNQVGKLCKPQPQVPHKKAANALPPVKMRVEFGLFKTKLNEYGQLLGQDVQVQPEAQIVPANNDIITV